MILRHSLHLLALLPATALAADVEISGDVTPGGATSPVWNIPDDHVQVGANGVGSLTVGGSGSVSAERLTIGTNETGVGTVELSGGARLTTSEELTVGGAGHGTLRIAGDASVESVTVNIGGAGGSPGPGETNGLLEISGGSLVASQFLLIGGTLMSGVTPGGAGTLKITGGEVSTPRLWFYSPIGYALPAESKANIDISGGRLTTTEIVLGEYDFASIPGGGSATVSASMSLGGTGVVSCADFGLVANGGRSATMTISGGTLNATRVSIGVAMTTPVIASGDTRLNITGGSVSSNEGQVAVTDTTSNAVIHVSGGSWTVANTLAVAGGDKARLEIAGGAVSTTDLSILTGGVVDVSDGNLTVSNNLQLGGAADQVSTLAISGTGAVSSASATVGYGTPGKAKVSGGSWTNTGFLDLGYFGGNGTLEISGGSVSALSGRIGYNGGTGLLQVSGGSWSSLSLFVGHTGYGTLEISGTGDVTAAFGTTVADYHEQATGALNLNGGVLTTSQVVEGIGAGTVTFDGGTLQLTGPQSNLFSTFETGDVKIASYGTIDTQGYAVASAYDFAGAGLLIKDGSGTLTLSTAASLVGFRVRNGTLALTGGGAWTTTQELAIGFDGAGALSVDGSLASGTGHLGYLAGSSGQASFGAGTSWTLASDLTVGRAGAGSLTVNGGLVIAQGVVKVGALSGGQGTITLGSGTLNTTKVVKGAGSGSVVFNGGTLQARKGEADFLSGFGAGDVTIQSGGAFIDTNGFTVGIAAPIGGTGSLNFQGGGTLTLSGANTYSGGTNVPAGLLRVAGSGTIGNGSSLVGAGAASGEAGGLLSFYDNSSAGSGTIRNAGASVSLAYGGATSFYNNSSAGSARLIANGGSNGGRGGVIAFLDNSSGGTSRIEVYGNGLLNIAGHTAGGVSIGSLGGNGVVSLGTNKLTVGSLNENDTFAGIIAGTGSFAKTGTGGLTLSGANIYTGPTTVEAGALFVNGSLTSSVTVKNGATFGGDGIVDAITLESGAMLSPVGSLEADSLTWNPGATLAFGLGDGFGDVLDLDGAFTKGDAGAFDFIFVDLGWEFGQTYTLVTFDSTNFAESDFGIGNGDDFGGTFTLTDHALQFTLTAPIPEPANFGLLAAGAGLAAATLRRRRR